PRAGGVSGIDLRGGNDQSFADGYALFGHRHAGDAAGGGTVHPREPRLVWPRAVMIIARAPVRISFFGGGTDYPEYFLREGGAVLATAIDKFSYVTASPFLSHLFDYSMRISYRKVELVRAVRDIEHNVYRECLKLCGIDKDIELHNVADLPAFTGLGSSSAFTVSLLHALHSFRGEFLRPHELA